MYETQQDTQPKVIEQRTTSLEESIQSLIDLIGPKQRRPWKTKIDLTTTPVQFAIIDNILSAAQRSVDSAIASVEATNEVAAQVAAG